MYNHEISGGCFKTKTRADGLTMDYFCPLCGEDTLFPLRKDLKAHIKDHHSLKVCAHINNYACNIMLVILWIFNCKYYYYYYNYRVLPCWLMRKVPGNC
jgi:hypothetical protein